LFGPGEPCERRRDVLREQSLRALPSRGVARGPAQGIRLRRDHEGVGEAGAVKRNAAVKIFPDYS
jgi:hypothetical protein